MKIEHILVPVDFSGSSQQAIDLAVSLREQFPAQITFIHAVEPFFAYGLEISPAVDVEAARERSAGKRLAEFALAVPQAKTVCLAGKPWRVICDWAAENNVDLIVISTHGYSGLQHLWQGSVAERVVQNAPCAVLAIRGRAG